MHARLPAGSDSTARARTSLSYRIGSPGVTSRRTRAWLPAPLFDLEYPPTVVGANGLPICSDTALQRGTTKPGIGPRGPTTGIYGTLTTFRRCGSRKASWRHASDCGNDSPTSPLHRGRSHQDARAAPDRSGRGDRSGRPLRSNEDGARGRYMRASRCQCSGTCGRPRTDIDERRRSRVTLPRRPRRHRPVLGGRTDGFRITGARWSIGGAEAPLKQRAARANDDFDEYWRFHLDREWQRLHETRYADVVLPAAA